MRYCSKPGGGQNLRSSGRRTLACVPAAPSACSASVRARMVAQRRTGTAPELALRAELRGSGLCYRVDGTPIAGFRRRADLQFRDARVAVFVHGCFWHGCPRHASWPRANAAWWRAKIRRNRRRDRQTAERLRAAGWAVITVWAHEPVASAARRVVRMVTRREGTPGRPGGCCEPRRRSPTGRRTNRSAARKPSGRPRAPSTPGR